MVDNMVHIFPSFNLNFFTSFKRLNSFAFFFNKDNRKQKIYFRKKYTSFNLISDFKINSQTNNNLTNQGRILICSLYTCKSML